MLTAGERGEPPVLFAAGRQLEEYFAGERVSFDLLLEPLGTPIQQVVWGTLREIS